MIPMQTIKQMADDPTMQRLDESIDWYDRKAGHNQLMYKAGKLIVIVAAAMIPFLGSIKGVELWHTGALGVLIAVVEGVQQLNQYHSNWSSYRATCEGLKHEKYLFLAKAGSYAAATDAQALLAERVESLLSLETAKWTSVQESAEKKQPAPGDHDKGG